MAKNNFYAVRVGRNPGIYESWEECEAQVKKFPNSQYKGFKKLKEARAYMEQEPQQELKNPTVSIPTEKKNTIAKKYDAVFYVDGSYFAQYGVYGYGVVAILKDGSTRVFSGAGNNDESKKLRNVAGEMLGALYATRWALNQQYSHIAIYYDYTGIEYWATGQWKTNTELTKRYAETMRDWTGGKMKVDFIKVKGHSGVQYNELADSLAKKAVEDFKK